jgi:glycine betaine/choline ABC-type transport system substrate-binding protein
MSPLITRRAALKMMGASALVATGCSGDRAKRVVVGSKNFTEQIILAELLGQQIEAHTATKIDRRLNLGGTLICHQALLSGQLDMYSEYTGTALTAILGQSPTNDPAEVYQRVRDAYHERFGLVVGPPIGFNNTFAIVIRGEDAERLRLRTISEMAQYAPRWRPGFGYEFVERSDGYRGLTQAYGLKFASDPQIMDLGLLYRALREKRVDVVAGNSTDGLIAALGMAILEDDRHYFPPYQAVTIARQVTLDQHPDVRAALDALGGKISDEDMRRMNFAVDGDQRDPAVVARDFRRAHGL